jgi:hypothetical protein
VQGVALKGQLTERGVLDGLGVAPPPACVGVGPQLAELCGAVAEVLQQSGQPRVVRVATDDRPEVGHRLGRSSGPFLRRAAHLAARRVGRIGEEPQSGLVAPFRTEP